MSNLLMGTYKKELPIAKQQGVPYRIMCINLTSHPQYSTRMHEDLIEALHRPFRAYN